MNEADERKSLKATVARLEGEVARMIAPSTGTALLVRARSGQRLALSRGAADLCSLPVLGWAAAFP